jgi:Protein of unknown function (DUF3990)
MNRHYKREMDLEDGGGVSSDRVVKRKTSTRLPSRMPLSVLPSVKEFMIASGWKRSFVARITDTVTAQETLEHHCRRFARDWFRATAAQDTFHERLMKCGMNKRFVADAYSVMKRLVDTCYTNEDMFEKLMDYVLGEGHLEQLKPASSFMFDGAPVDAWVKHDRLGSVCNVSDKRRISNIIGSLPRSNVISNYTLFYHCTNWNCGQRIIEIGPKTYAGRRCLDFGISPSFYMTPDVGTALEWAARNDGLWGSEAVILMFRVSNIILKGKSKHFKVKVFDDADEEWKTLVKSSRKCEDTQNDLDGFHFVYGPIAKNVVGIKTRGEEPVPWAKSLLAVKREKAEEYLAKNLMGSLWLEKKPLARHK